MTSPAQKHRGLTLSDRHAGRFSLQNPHLFLASRPLYIDRENPVNDKPEYIQKYDPAGGCLADESAAQGRIIDCESCASSIKNIFFEIRVCKHGYPLRGPDTFSCTKATTKAISPVRHCSIVTFTTALPAEQIPNSNRPLRLQQQFSGQV